MQRSRVSLIAREILPGLLRQCCDLDIGEISGEDQDRIAALVGHVNSQGEVSLLALNALVKIGTGRVLQPLMYAKKAELSRSTRARLEEVLPIIRERADNETASAMLLRPANADYGGNLLRPAGFATSDANLLRPAETPVTHNIERN